MRFEHQGITIWYGTPDAPAPISGTAATTDVSITVGVQPADASNRVEVLYRVNQGESQRVEARYLRAAPARRAQYFRAKLPTLRPGDTVAYHVRCRCAGRQAPRRDEIEDSTSAFTVVEVGGEGANDRPEGLTSPSSSSTSRSANNDQVSGHGNRGELDVRPAILAQQDTLVKPGDPAGRIEVRNLQKPQRQVSYPLRILDSGPDVATLHKALEFLKFGVAQREKETQRFGRTTRQAILAFQKRSNLTASGQVDEATAKRLGDTLTELGFFQNKPPPFRRHHLRFKLRNPEQLEGEAQDFVRQRLNEQLKEAVLRQFSEPSEALQTAVRELALNYAEVIDEPLSAVMFNRVLPALLDKPDLEEEVEQKAGREFSQSTQTVSDLLHLDQPVDQHPFFQEEARRAKNEAVAKIAQLNEKEMDALDDLELTQVDKNTLDQFINDGRLRAEVRNDLLNVAEFAKLTDDDFAAVEALRSEGLKHPEDLITKDRKDWVAFLDRHNIEPPEGYDRKGFAKFIDLNVQLAFRTSYTMERFSRDVEEDVLEKINDLQPILARNSSVLVDIEVNPDLDLSEIAEEDHPRIQMSLRSLNRFTNRYTRLGVREILNDPVLSVKEKRNRIVKRQTALRTFHEHNPAFDLAWANFFAVDSTMARAFEPNWEGLDEDDKQPVRSFLTALQRTLRLTATHDEMDALLAAGLDSADAVRRLPENELRQLTGLEPDVIRRIRAQAVDTGVRLSHFFSMIEESTTHRPFLPDAAKEAADVPDLGIINLLKEIDGYADFFGNQNFCRCKHCRSIFSPGAYFVDLMRFIDTHISKPNFVNPGKTDHALYLKNRRPDLWHLQLSCKNTDTLIPYLTIVNEALADYLERVFDETDIFDALTTARVSFRQPFNLPFAELQLYLRHFGVRLHHIYELFDGSETNHVRAILGLSPEEFTTIVTADLDNVVHRYGNPDNLGRLDVQNLIKHMDVTREDLGRLLALDYIRIDLLAHFDIDSKQNDLVGFSETLAISLDTEFAILFTRLESIVRLLLDRLHRFVRLWRVLPWTPEDIDLLIAGIKLRSLLRVTPTSTEQEHRLAGSRLHAALLTVIADLRRLQEDLSLSFQEAYALVVDLPLTGSKPNEAGLFQRLFGEVGFLNIRHPALQNNPPEDPVVSPDFGVLQGGLRVDEAELLGLISAKLSKAVVLAGIVKYEDISRLYRYARFARALGWRSSELLLAGQILNLDLDQNETNERIEAVRAFQAFATALDRSPFSLAELSWLLLSEANGPAGILNTAELLADIWLDIQEGGQLIFTPEDLLPIEGLDLEGARRLLHRFRNDTASDERTAVWLKVTQAEQTSYVLVADIGFKPDSDLLKSAIDDAALVVANDDTPESAAEKEAIIADIATAVAERLQARHPVTLFIAQLIERLGVTTEFFNRLSPFLSTTFTSPQLLAAIFQWSHEEAVSGSEGLVNLIHELQQHLYVLKTKLELPEESLTYIAQRPEVFSLNLPIAWSWEGLRRLSRYREFAGKTPETRAAMHRLLSNWTSETFGVEAKEDIALILGVSPFNLGPLLERIVMPSNPFDALSKVSKAASLAKTLGLDGVALKQLTATSYEGLTTAKNLAYGAIRAKYYEAEWPKIAEPFEDELNMLKRDALVDRILSREFQLKFSDTREIYQFFLLDVDMDGCARISRVKEAISACQLYMHRCLMSLEQSQSGDVRVRVKNAARNQWPWRKNYRVWEANRKVFLYPENYLEPDLRDNKSHIFKQAEADLMQRALTPIGLEAIYKDYLREFSDLANIIIVSAYYDKPKKTYLLFGRTRRKPYQYYYRKLIRLSRWTMWEPIDLTIEAKRVNAVKHQGQFYLFWLSPIKSDEADRVVDQGKASSVDTNDESKGIPLMVNYSVMDEREGWSGPQSLIFYMNKDVTSPQWGRLSDDIFPESLNEIRLSHVLFYSPREVRGHLDLFNNSIHDADSGEVQISDTYSVKQESNKKRYRISGLRVRANPSYPTQNDDGALGSERFLFSGSASSYLSEAAAQYQLRELAPPDTIRTASFPAKAKYDLRVVNNHVKDNIFQFRDQFLLIKRTNNDGWPQHISNFWEVIAALNNTKRKSFLLSTSVATKLSKKLFNKGLDKFLSLETQRIIEKPISQRGLEFKWAGELAPPIEGGNILAQSTHLDFKGAYGGYFREMFFHLPFLIAYYLNAKQKFADADYWYRKIFDPTAQPPSEKKPSKDDKWRFIEFRALNLPKLKHILTDEEAIDVYERDPFNPFAIARLRISAFQKATVMRYIDNLLDWGDHLFSQDTFESINEATMLYVMAADILGDRPIEVGDCDMIKESSLTYDQIVRQNAARSDFLIELENVMYFFVYSPYLAELSEVPKNANKTLSSAGIPAEAPESVARSSGFTTLRENRRVSFVKTSELASTFATTTIHTTTTSAANVFAFEPADDDSSFEPADDLTVEFDPPGPLPPADIDDYHIAVSDPQNTPERQVHLAFCVPPNETLLGYWDRVEDRLFKIRHCMNIEGVRRQLPLFQPQINPLLLVRAKAAGLSLEDILGQLNTEMPSYRFRTLLEKARQFTATVQQLGNQIQGALERKDSEELALLQSTQQDEINEAIRQVKLDNKREATQTRLSVNDAKLNVQNRKNYYHGILNDAIDKELVLNKEEASQIEKLDEGQGKRKDATDDEKHAANISLARSWSADIGGGFGFEFSPAPGPNLNIAAQVSYGSPNLVALFTKRGQKDRNEAATKDFEASQAALRASHLRRKAEWEQQEQQADIEYLQLEKQHCAAKIREEIAKKDLAVHQKQTKHAHELYEFYKDKFTDLGLYTYLSISLSRLYREAYNLAHDMALKAQRAYQFETDDQTFFIKNDNWDIGKAGLLAGERLLLQLQKLEQNYLERNQRTYEITLPCSLAQINPQALLALQQNGACDFTLPEDWFDLYYPGQYKRRIKSVRFTIPCVTGPYANVSAKLTLTGSYVRLEPKPAPQLLTFVPTQRNTSIATSTANTDAGLFELNFNDERYLPFEGAGAVSSWRLELPREMRTFDYGTISDIIVHVSYTAKDDGQYRATVEANLKQKFRDLAQSQNLIRLISLNREFPSEFHRLAHPQEGQSAATTIRLSKRHFPFFLRDEHLALSALRIILEPKSNQVPTLDYLADLNQNISMLINDVEVSDWAFDGDLNLPASSSLSLNTLQIADEGTDLMITIEGSEMLDLADIWLKLGYSFDS